MIRAKTGAGVVLAAAALICTPAPAPATTNAIPRLWSNCKHVNARYAHGVGKYGARDHTSGIPVTNFTHSTRLYRIAMSYNRGLDRDKDGIACEKLLAARATADQRFSTRLPARLAD